ncbi:MAG: hypothetical protein K2Q14_03160, partial [Gammaproteobacteria bacterium]|nr:hypothetical protein [Gammaproteobacteria bacterium]
SFTANILSLEHRNNEYELIDLLKSCEEKKSRNHIFYIARAKFSHAHVDNLSTPHVQTPSMTIDTMIVSATTNVQVSSDVSNSNSVSLLTPQPGEMTMSILTNNAPFQSYLALLPYYQGLQQPEIDRLDELLLALIRDLSGQTNEIRGLITLVQCASPSVQRAVVGRLHGIGIPLLRAGFYPTYYETAQAVADSLAYAPYPDPKDFPARELVELLKLFLKDAVQELAIMGDIKAPRPLLALQAAARLAECLLLNNEGVFGLDYLQDLHDLSDKLAQTLDACRKTHVLHAFWGDSLANALKAMTHRLTSQEETRFKQGVALELAQTLGAGGKGLVHLGIGTTSLGMAIALSATVGAFHLLPEALFSFGQGVYELLKSGYRMKQHLGQARAQWRLLHPDDGKTPPELADQQERKAETAQALWIPLAQELAKVTPESLKQLDRFAIQWWVYHLTTLLIVHPAPNEVTWQLRSVFFILYRQYHDQPDIQRFVLLHAQLLANHGYLDFDFASQSAEIIDGLLQYAPTPEQLSDYALYNLAKQQANNKNLHHDQRKSHKKERDRLEKLLTPHLLHLQHYQQLNDYLARLSPYSAPEAVQPFKGLPVTLQRVWFQYFPLDQMVYELTLSYEGHLQDQTLDKHRAGLWDKFQKIGRDTHEQNRSSWGKQGYGELEKIMQPWEKEMKKSQGLVQANYLEVKQQLSVFKSRLKFIQGAGKEAIEVEYQSLKNHFEDDKRRLLENVPLPSLVYADKMIVNKMETTLVSIEIVNKLNQLEQDLAREEQNNDIQLQAHSPVKTPVNPANVSNTLFSGSNNNNHAHNNSSASNMVVQNAQPIPILINYIKLGLTKPEQQLSLQFFIQEQGMDDALGYVIDSVVWNEKKTLVKSLSFESQEYAEVFSANLMEEAARLKTGATFSANPT